MKGIPDRHRMAAGYCTALASAIILSTTGILISFLTQVYAMPPVVLAFWRNGILACSLFLAFELFYPVLVEINSRQCLFLAGFGVLLAVFNVLWTTSVAVNGAAVATVLVYSSVIFTVILSRPVLGEPLTWSKIIAVAVASAGCLLVLKIHPAHFGAISLLGIGTGIGSGLMFALYTIVGRSSREHDLSPWTTLCYSFGFAALYLGGFNASRVYSGISATTDIFWLKDAYAGWAVLALLALGPTLLGFALYNLSLDRLEAGKVNLIAATEPAFTAVIAYLVLGESLSRMQILGGGFIFGAILFLRLAESGFRQALPLAVQARQG